MVPRHTSKYNRDPANGHSPTTAICLQWLLFPPRQTVHRDPANGHSPITAICLQWLLFPPRQTVHSLTISFVGQGVFWKVAERFVYTEKKVKNSKGSWVCLTKFEVCGNIAKHYLDCLMCSRLKLKLQRRWSTIIAVPNTVTVTIQ